MTQPEPAVAEAVVRDEIKSRGPLHYPRQFNAPTRIARAAKLSAGHLLLGGIMAALAVWATWWAWEDAWRLVDLNGDNSHVLMVPIVVVALAWVRRGRVPHVRVTGRYMGLLGIVAGWALMVFGEQESISFFYHLGALLVAIGAAVSICGKGLVLRFMPVIGALLFLVPVPGFIRQDLAIPLQEVTANITAKLLMLVGIDASVAGNTLVVNDRHVMIADACNGMPMAFGLLLVTYAFAFAWPMLNSVRWVLLALTPLVTLACNVLRTTPLTYAYAYSGDDLGNLLHEYTGWLMLPMAFLVLLGIVKLLRWFDLRVDRYRLAAQ
ncbi:MAG: exosortase/archaeosortase family protein [Planctomycetota bacterium]